MDRRQFLASAALAPLATLPEIGYTAPQTDADKVRELVGDLLPGCEFYDGPPVSRDGFGNKYRVFALGAVMPMLNADAMLLSEIKRAVGAAGAGAKVCQVRQYLPPHDSRAGQRYYTDGDRLCWDGGYPTRLAYLRLSFWPDNTVAPSMLEKAEGEAPKTVS